MSFALSSLLCISMNLAGQSALVFLANRNLDHWTQIREQGIVWTCTKPGFDAYRVSVKKKREVGTIFDVRVEQTARKVIELVFECLPGTFIQMLAMFVKGGDTSMIPVTSLLLSIFTAAFISADMSYSWDSNAENRKTSPEFYGFLPKGVRRRALLTILMFSLSTFNLAARTLIYVLLWTRGGAACVVTAILAEHVLYLIVKMLRNDIWYWIPVYGCLGMFKSFVARVFVKAVADWTSCVQFRHPNEVGGLYWTGTLLCTVVVGPLVALMHVSPSGTVPHSIVVRLMLTTCGCLLVSFVVFLLSIEDHYVKSFFDKGTSSSYLQLKYMNAETDDSKHSIFTTNEHKWREAMGEDVRAWLEERLPVWIESQPAWFDDHAKSIIPDWAFSDLRTLSLIRDEKVESIRTTRRISVLGL